MPTFLTYPPEPGTSLRYQRSDTLRSKCCPKHLPVVALISRESTQNVENSDTHVLADLCVVRFFIEQCI